MKTSTRVQLDTVEQIKAHKEYALGFTATKSMENLNRMFLECAVVMQKRYDKYLNTKNRSAKINGYTPEDWKRSIDDYYKLAKDYN